MGIFTSMVAEEEVCVMVYVVLLEFMCKCRLVVGIFQRERERERECEKSSCLFGHNKEREPQCVIVYLNMCVSKREPE